jgi:flagellar basal-body rod protein FlgB
MNIADLPAFSVLREKMNFLAERQRVLSQNVANASTPGYVPKDLNVDGFEKALASQLKVREGGVAVARTSGQHIDMNASRNLSGDFRAKAAPDSDVTLDGNAVVLEDQMLKVSRTRGEYETMVAIYQRALGMMRTAIKAASR